MRAAEKYLETKGISVEMINEKLKVHPDNMWWFVMVFLILQWKARSLIANGQELKNLILKEERCPDIMCSGLLVETMS